jgi:hypothetical protein
MLSAIIHDTVPPVLSQAFASAKQRMTCPLPIAGLASARTRITGEFFFIESMGMISWAPAAPTDYMTDFCRT